MSCTSEELGVATCLRHASNRRSIFDSIHISRSPGDLLAALNRAMSKRLGLEWRSTLTVRRQLRLSGARVPPRSATRCQSQSPTPTPSVLDCHSV
jgi:hypothetical protein